MKHIAAIALGLIIAGSLVGCTDADIAHYEAIGSDGHITCYSGTATIYDAESSGKIHTTNNSDGWELMDKTSGRLVRVSGTCVVTN